MMYFPFRVSPLYPLLLSLKLWNTLKFLPESRLETVRLFHWVYIIYGAIYQGIYESWKFKLINSIHFKGVFPTTFFKMNFISIFIKFSKLFRV